MAAIERGKLTQAQLRQLSVLEAAALGLSFDDVVRLVRARTLPEEGAISADLGMLVQLLR